MAFSITEELSANPTLAALPAHFDLVFSAKSTKAKDPVSVVYSISPDNDVWFEENSMLVKEVTRDAVLSVFPIEIHKDIKLVRGAGGKIRYVQIDAIITDEDNESQETGCVIDTE